jgi:hypothetical protein
MLFQSFFCFIFNKNYMLLLLAMTCGLDNPDPIITSPADLLSTPSPQLLMPETGSVPAPVFCKKARNHSCPTRAFLFYWRCDFEIKIVVQMWDSSVGDQTPAKPAHRSVFENQQSPGKAKWTH